MFDPDYRGDLTGENPDRLFERRWALTVLETVLQSLEREFRDKGKQELFATLSGFLAWNSGTTTYAVAGEKLGMKEGAVKVAVVSMAFGCRNTS